MLRPSGWRRPALFSLCRRICIVAMAQNCGLSAPARGVVVVAAVVGAAAAADFELQADERAVALEALEAEVEERAAAVREAEAATAAGLAEAEAAKRAQDKSEKKERKKMRVVPAIQLRSAEDVDLDALLKKIGGEA